MMTFSDDNLLTKLSKHYEKKAHMEERAFGHRIQENYFLLTY
jgi:hypothetical protein